MPGVLPGPDDDDGYESLRDQLVDALERLLPAEEPDLDPGDLGLLLDWKRAYGDGRLDRWHRSDLEEFLLDWFPAKVSASAADVRGTPRTVALAMGLLDQQGLLRAGSEQLDVLASHAIGLQEAFLTAMDDPANFGMAKSLFAGLDLGGEDLSPELLDAAISRFNALPEDERRSLTGGPPSDVALDDIIIGPVVPPDERTLRRAALASPVTTAFVQLGDYFEAPGRLLTKTGNLRLADARALVELLGTTDTFRERGSDDWQGSTRSASQLPVLDQWKWWAGEVGVVRPRHGRLVAVEAWRKRARKDPLRELLRALQLLADVGPLRSYRWWGWTPVDSALDSSVGPLLSRLLEAPDGLPYDGLVEEWQSLMLTLRVSEYYPGQVRSAFSQLVDVLERVGVVVHHEMETSETPAGVELRGAGALALSQVGVRFAIDLLTEQGVTVQLVPPPEAQTVDGLVGLATEVDVDVWWRMTWAWLDVQPDDIDALVKLLSALERADDPALVLVTLEDPSDEAVVRLGPALRQLAQGAGPDSAELPLLAAAWLDRHAQLDAEVDPAAAVIGGLIGLGRLAVSAPELMIEMLTTGHDAPDAYAFIQLVGQLLPPYAVELLKAVGDNHPDKAVAKAARKQLFRTQSRLVQQRRSTHS